MKNELKTSFDSSVYTGPKLEAVKLWMDLFAGQKLTPAYLREWFLANLSESTHVEECGPMYRGFQSSPSSPPLTPLLEEFVFNGEKCRVIESLQRTGLVTYVCGKSIKHGEPSYSCWECSMDHTCVLCTDCFQKSQHRHHKYRMSISSGGGWCDCGDAEAWKSHPSCEPHKPTHETKSMPPFPSDIYARSKLVFSFIVQFSHDVINKFYGADVLPDQLLSTVQYVLLLHNDEIHTFEQVANILNQVTLCTEREGLELASRINKEGRAIIISADFETCALIKTNIERLNEQSGVSRYLEVHILPLHIIAQQSFALESLAWMQGLLETSQGFRSALIEVLEDGYMGTAPLLDEILVHDSVLWKSARKQWYGLLCSGFLLDVESKKTLASHYLTKYPQIMGNYLIDEEDHTFFTAALSVQLFTVPSITQELISRYGALESVVNLIIHISINHRNANGKVVFKKFSRSYSRTFERACFLLYDLRYLLCSPPTCSWSDGLREGFCRGMSSFFDFLEFIEGMDAFKRQLGSHIEFESEWVTAFELQAKCSPIITNSLKWCSFDEQALVEVFNTVVNKLKRAHNYQQYDKTVVHVLESTFRLKKFDTSKNAVTIHLPLTRYWGVLYCMMVPKTHLDNTIRALPIVQLIDPVMETRAMIAQFRAGMWHKNGQSLSGQVFNYQGPKLRAMTHDIDILMLQIGASLIDSDAFLSNLAYKFGIVSVIFPVNESQLPETDSSQMWGLVDEFLYLIIALIAERFHSEARVANVTSLDCIKYELVHVLAIKPLSHSELSQAIGPQSDHGLELQTALDELTTLNPATVSHEAGKYNLKDGYHDNFNVFNYHFTKEMSCQSDQVQKIFYKKQHGLECCPPPTLPPFLDPFSKVINLLNSGFMLHTMKIVLDQWEIETKLDLDGHLRKVIFLFGLALQEETRSNKFVFTAKPSVVNLVTQMLGIYCSGKLKDHKDLLKWVLQNYGILSDDQSVAAAMFDYDEKQKQEPSHSNAKAHAEAARAKIMASMGQMQLNFNKSLQECVDRQDYLEAAALNSEVTLICILCRERESVGMDGKTMVYAAFVQLSTVHMRCREPFTKEDLGETFLTSKMGPSPFISTCGHIMHAGCWETWRLNAATGRAARASFSHEPAKKEFLCPLCESISNVVIPILPYNTLNNINASKDCEPSLTFRQWLCITLKQLHVAQLSEKPSPGKPEVYQDDAVGYILDVNEKWMINIKLLYDELQFKQEAGWMAIPTEKLNWIHALASDICQVGKDCQSPLGHNWDCAMVWKTLAYTIHSLEACSRHSGNPIFSELTPREEACLENMIRISYVLGVTGQPHFQRIANQCANNLLNMVMINEKDMRCVLEWDCFGVLVELLVAVPNIVSGNSAHVQSIENCLVRLMLYSRIAQILITFDFKNYEIRSPQSKETGCLLFIANILGHKLGAFESDEVWEEVKKRLRPFLRCCSIFFHYKHPENFTEELNLKDDTFENLGSYLQLPTSCSELLNDDLTQHLFMSWAKHPKIRAFHEERATSWKFEPYLSEIGVDRINRLVILPQEYSELLNHVRDFSCIHSEIDDSPDPTMCLICGKILCSLSYCCQTDLNQQKVGACTFHAHECGAGVGIFLRIRKCMLIVFAGTGKGCFKTPPYLDEHHEPDQGLRRGNKLLLCEENYRKLELLWINHSLYEMVTRSIEMSGFDSGSWLFF